MTIDDAMQDIESPRLCATVNVANTYKTFIRILASQPAVQYIKPLAREATAASKILKRILELCHAPVEPSLENPADAALAAYLWLLSEANPDLAAFAAEVISQCSKCWWARLLANMTRSSCAFRSHTRFTLQAQGPYDAGMATGQAGVILYGFQSWTDPTLVNTPYAENRQILVPALPGSRLVPALPGNRLEDYFRNVNTGNRLPKVEV